MTFQCKLNADQEKQIANLYLQGESTIKIAKRFNVNHVTIINYLDRQNVERRVWSNKLSESDIEEMIRAYRTGVSSNLLADQYHITPQGVRHWLRKRGVPIRHGKAAFENRIAHRTYTLDESFFDVIDTEEKAYWLGFLAADGSVRDLPRETRLTLNLSIRDINHVNKFRAALGSDAPVKYHRKCARVSIHNYHIVSSLSKYGIVPNKTFSTYFPTLESSLERHFIRGVIDGDGCFSVRILKTGTLDPRFNVIGYKELVSVIADKIRQECNIKGSLYQAYGCADGIFRFDVGGRLQVNRLHEYLYTNATIYLDRKQSLNLG